MTCINIQKSCFQHHRVRALKPTSAREIKRSMKPQCRCESFRPGAEEAQTGCDVTRSLHRQNSTMLETSLLKMSSAALLGLKALIGSMIVWCNICRATPPETAEPRPTWFLTAELITAEELLKSQPDALTVTAPTNWV